VPEATSGGLMVLLINIATLIFLFVSPLITTTWINTIQMLTMVGCFIMVRIHHSSPTIAPAQGLQKPSDRSHVSGGVREREIQAMGGRNGDLPREATALPPSTSPRPQRTGMNETYLFCICFFGGMIGMSKNILFIFFIKKNQEKKKLPCGLKC
jgi:hypothetical protein